MPVKHIKFTAALAVTTLTTVSMPAVFAYWHHHNMIQSVAAVTDVDPSKHIHHHYMSATVAHVKPAVNGTQTSNNVGEVSHGNVNVTHANTSSTSQPRINVTAGNGRSNVPTVIPPGPSVWRDFPSAPSQGIKYDDQLTMEMDVNASKIDKLHPLGK